MAKSKEGYLINKILARHGARPDCRLWRNETAQVWLGNRKGVTVDGDLVLWKGWSRMLAGLFKGSPDLVGIKLVDGHGIFVGIEVKTENVLTTLLQSKAIAMIQNLGGIGGVVKSVEEVDALLGEPPA